jgi:hypothetical protein
MKIHYTRVVATLVLVMTLALSIFNNQKLMQGNHDFCVV